MTDRSFVPMRAGHGIILITVGLLTLGVVMVTSAGLNVTSETNTIADVLAGRMTWLAVLAIVTMLVAARAPLDQIPRLHGLASPAPWIMLVTVALLVAVHIPGLRHEVNGARRWIEIGPIGFQPSEIAKWGLIIVLAWHAARHADAMNRFWTGLVVPMTLVGMICLLIATEDLGTAVLIALVAIVMLIAAGARLLHALTLVPVAAAGFVAAVLASPYRIQRLATFVDPYADPQGTGYHVVQSMAAVAGGGLPGRGLGNGLQKFGYLPEDTTDFIFAVICEELGVAGAVLVVAAFVGLLCCGFRIVVAATTPFARLLGLGILLTIGLQATINLLVVTGLAPTKGIALPLISSGGTGWCLTAFSLGLLLAIERSTIRVHEVMPQACRPVGQLA